MSVFSGSISEIQMFSTNKIYWNNASEVTTLWRYRNLYIIIIIIRNNRNAVGMQTKNLIQYNCGETTTL